MPDQDWDGLAEAQRVTEEGNRETAGSQRETEGEGDRERQGGRELSKPTPKKIEK